MPGSAISGGSQGSSGSRRARTRQYHTVANTSRVDESLFGGQKRQVSPPCPEDGKQTDVGIEQQARVRQMKRGNCKLKRETVAVVTKDLIRNLIVPQEDPSGYTMIVSRGQFDRIRRSAMVKQAEDIRAEEEERVQTKDDNMRDSQARKNLLKERDLLRVKNQGLNDLEQEQKEKSEYLRMNANAQLQEQEDEIKHLNELILNAKCHAIRDAQVLEKEEIGKEMTAEEKRLDQMMEYDRVNAIKVEEGIDKKRAEERRLGALKVMEQIDTNEQQRLLSLEHKEQENELMQRYIDKLCEEDAEHQLRHYSDQNQLRADLNQCNTDLMTHKEHVKERERVLDESVLVYQRAKAERETALEREAERIRVDKEKETGRLRALQERSRDEQSARDELRARRQQEEAERAWRAREQQAARTLAETEATLRAARSNQLRQHEHMLAIQAQRERVDFERVLRAQKELLQKEQVDTSERRQHAFSNAADVRAQIREREQARIGERNAFFEEGAKLDEEARQRRQRLEEVKRKKLDELRAMGLPEKYVNGVARKCQVPVDAV